MSDTPQGPGWWQASDGKYYPPQGQAAPQGFAPPAPPAPEQKKKGGCLKYGLIALLVLVVLGVIGGALSGSSDDDKENASTTETTEASSNSTEQQSDAPAATVAPATTAKKASAKCSRDYPDKQPKDQCPGESVQLSGYTTTVTGAHRVGNDPFGKLICADAAIENRDTKSQPYNEFDFSIQFPSGDVQTPTIHSQEPKLGSGTLVDGGKKSGVVCFEDNGETGEAIIIWKPDAFNADRGLWFVGL
jgi:hypothetical protein